jgi:hypothetical protein
MDKSIEVIRQFPRTIHALMGLITPHAIEAVDTLTEIEYRELAKIVVGVRDELAALDLVDLTVGKVDDFITGPFGEKLDSLEAKPTVALEIASAIRIDAAEIIEAS